MLVIPLRHPGGVLGCLGGGVGRHDQAAVLHESHRGVHLACPDLPILYDDAIFQPEMQPEIVAVRQVFVQPHIPALGQFGAQAEKHPSLRGNGQIPDGIMLRVLFQKPVRHRLGRQGPEEIRGAGRDGKQCVVGCVRHVMSSPCQPAAIFISSRRAFIKLALVRVKVVPLRTRLSTSCLVLLLFFFAASTSSS